VFPVPSEPFRRRNSYALRKDSRQGGRIGISYGGRDQLERVALTQHCLGNPQPPICQVIKWGSAHRRNEAMESRTDALFRTSFEPLHPGSSTICTLVMHNFLRLCRSLRTYMYVALWEFDECCVIRGGRGVTHPQVKGSGAIFPTSGCFAPVAEIVRV